MNKIDFVITWVDGNDKVWQKEKNKYQATKDNDNKNIRYREWDNLKYWFRSVEKYANWVNKIYFITYGHIPEWLDTTNKKLVIVNHKDFIPEKYLPTFNSCAIELNMYRIKRLSENFVYFNDDMFFNDYTKPTDFFKKDLPCEYAILTTIVASGQDKFEHRIINNMEVINKHFNMKKCIKSNFSKWFNIKYGTDQIRTLLLMSWNNFPAIKFSHSAISFKKNTFKELWKQEPKIMNDSCETKFRNFTGVNPWVAKDWQIATGKISPRKPSFSKFYIIDNDNSEIIKDIKSNKHKLICLNDSDKIKDFELQKQKINNAFEFKLNKKSTFEK